MTWIALLAGTYSEAEHYAHSHKLKHWFYIRGRDHLRGYQNVQLRLVGSWERRKDLASLSAGLLQTGYHFWHEASALPQNWVIIQDDPWRDNLWAITHEGTYAL